MRGHRWKVGTIGLLTASGMFAQSTPKPEPALSKAESAIVSRQIATLRTSGERDMANDWSNAKKVAEIICRPAALRVLQQQSKDIDKVFLGMDTPGSLTLESNHRLTGTGEYRTSRGWQDISFVCTLDPTTDKVVSFQSKPLSK